MTPPEPSYWSLASRTAASKLPSLEPPRTLFRPESSLALDAGERVDDSDSTPTVRSTTPIAPSVDAPRLTYGLPGSVSSGPIAPRAGDVAWRASGKEVSQHVFSESSFPPSLDHSSDKGEALDHIQKLATSIPLKPSPAIRNEDEHEARFLGREVVPPSPPITPKVEAAVLRPAKQAAAIPAAALNVIPPTREAQSETRAPMRPPIVMAPSRSGATPKQPPKVDRSSPATEPQVRPTTESVERTALRIGSIVVHLEPPAPQSKPQTPAPVPAEPTVSLQREFTAFGFYQS